MIVFILNITSSKLRELLIPYFQYYCKLREPQGPQAQKVRESLDIMIKLIEKEYQILLQELNV